MASLGLLSEGSGVGESWSSLPDSLLAEANAVLSYSHTRRLDMQRVH